MTFAIALSQSNFTVGHIAGNIGKMAALHGVAEAAGAELVVFSEMAITGYPPEDLVLRAGFQAAAMEAVGQLAALTHEGPAIVVGGLWAEAGAAYNTVFLLDGGKVVHRQYKYELPNYGVFDEKRVFAPGPCPEAVSWRGYRLGLLVCEDMWQPDAARRLKDTGAQLLIAINASPYAMTKHSVRLQMAKARSAETGLPLLYVNQVGGQDELVFDGRSFALSPAGQLCVRCEGFAEDFALIRVEEEGGVLAPRPGEIKPEYGEEETIYRAMVLGLRDFVHKNSFKGVVLGLSGGIDSAFSAGVAVDALGPENVRALMLPSPYTSQESLDDAAECAKLLGITLDSVPIAPGMAALSEMLTNAVPEEPGDITMQNLQPRLRAAVLMAVSNNEGLMLLTTGNKSEMAVGYATLYGDMCGGYSVVKDVYKTLLYKIARWRDGVSHVIPERIFTKAPTAELKPGQTDQDSLPPYALLDAVLFRLIEEQRSVEEIVSQGYDAATVTRIANMLYQAEYKRRQAPPGLKITGMAFGRDRRYPIVSGWRT